MTRPVPQTDEFWTLPTADFERGERALWWSVNPEGHLGVILVHQRLLTPSQYVRGWVGLSPRLPFDATLVIVTDRGTRRFSLSGIDFQPRHLVLLARGGFVLTGSVWNEKTRSGHPTAAVFSTTGEGRVLEPYGLGNDLSAVIADPADRLWVAYGDEGMFGQKPWSQPALAGWDLEGRRIWGSDGRVSDVFNGTSAATEGDQVWLMWRGARADHTARINPSTGEVSSYPVLIDNCDGVAIRGTHALFSARDHNEPSLTLIRARRWEGVWVETDSYHLAMPGRVVLSCAQGRDGTLWIRAGDTWIRAYV
ncbi:hypothetical protein Kisp02_56220 [Kineosporia sp. NBRC 101731]|nr:hypothetical protein Kisp02_56220 [Kineosporia sp. NBRC 101731]